MTKFDKYEDPVSWSHIRVCEPDGDAEIPGVVGCDVLAKSLAIEVPDEAPAPPPVRRRRDGQEAAPKRVVVLRQYRDYDVRHGYTGDVLHRVRRFG